MGLVRNLQVGSASLCVNRLACAQTVLLNTRLSQLLLPMRGRTDCVFRRVQTAVWRLTITLKFERLSLELSDTDYSTTMCETYCLMNRYLESKALQPVYKKD